MRITPAEAQTIKDTARAVLGERAGVWLFGSRADDAKKGGDIDLYVELPPEDYAYPKQVQFWCALIDRLGDQKIDIVINKLGLSPALPIHTFAKRQGIKL